MQFIRFCAFVLICAWHADVYALAWFPRDKGAVNAVELFILLSGLASGYSSYSKDIYFTIKDTLLYVWKVLFSSINAFIYQFSYSI